MKNLFCIFFIIKITNCFSQGVWTQKASFPGTARGDAFSFSIGTKGYIGGGCDTSGGYVNDFWEYDALNNIWTQKANFGGLARWQAVAFSIGLKGYVGTGQDGSSAFHNDLWEYNSSANSWMQKASMPTLGRNLAVGFSIGNKGYIGSGQWGNPAYRHSDFWQYNPATNTWVGKANIPGARSFAVGLAIDGKGYIGTGLDSLTANFRDDFWEYDTLTDTWVQKLNFPGGTRIDIDGAHFAISNYVYIGSGRSLVSGLWVYYNDFWKYNPSNDTWTQIPNLPAIARLGASSFSINNKGYIGLGFWYNNFQNYLNDLWEYTDTTKVVAINEIKINVSTEIFPNPLTAATTIRMNSAADFKDERLKLFDVSGKTIREEGFSGKQIILKRESIESGVYFYQIISDNKIIAEGKLVVQ